MTYNIGMAVIIILLVVVVAIVLFGLGIEIRNAFLEYDELSVMVRVVGKNYSSSYTTTSFIQSGKVSVPQMHHHPAQYNVFLQWNEFEDCIDNEELYNSVEIGDVIEAHLHRGYNKAGVVKNSYFTVD